MKKNEEPHRLYVVFRRQNEVGLESVACSCEAGQGLCHHVIGFMYTLAHNQMLGFKSVPPVVSKTSKPQVNFSITLLKEYKLPVPFWLFMGLRQAHILLFRIYCKRVYFN